MGGFAMAFHYDGEFKLKKVEVGGMGNNCYILIDPASQEALIIDAAWEPERILKEVEGLKVGRILTTHGHHDHHDALDPVRQNLGVPGGIGAGDADMLKTPPDFTIADGEAFRFGSQQVRSIHTPGHTPGSTCFLIGKHLFTGDTLFPGGPGNTRKDPQRFAEIIASIRSRLFTLPEDTVVYPGHGADTTIGTEKPHLQEWIDRGW
jgi:glyoxylase-like metal-dependent hydrolase (beta-lactamase superfamily II)